MKRILIVLAATALLFGCNNTAKQSEESATETPDAAVEYVEVTLQVEGMTCGGCENAIKTGVESLEGIASVECSFEEGWTKVKYDKSTTSEEDIEGKISETGYTVKGEI